MAKQTNKKYLIGGKNAAIVNPLGLVKQYKAVCVNEGKLLSPRWRNSKSEAEADAQEHLDMGHYIDFQVRIV